MLTKKNKKKEYILFLYNHNAVIIQNSILKLLL